MTKNEFLSKLSFELKKNSIADADDIVGEYEQHFAFKMADGYSEEEIAARLGDPAMLASQFERAGGEKRYGGRKTIMLIGLYIADFFSGLFFVLLFAWEAIMAAFSLCSAAIAVSIFCAKSPWSLIPPMPYLSGVLFGIALLALAVLTGAGSIYFAAFIRQLMRSYGRFHKNTIAAASKGAILPSLAMHPQLPQKLKRCLRSVALLSLMLFAACFVLGIIVSMLSSGALEFWHAWGWFGYTVAK